MNPIEEKHLTGEQSEHLARAAEGYDPYEEEDIELLEHLETCRDCYEKYCINRTLAQAFDDVSPFLDTVKVNSESAAAEESGETHRILAAFSVIRDSAQSAAQAVINQLETVGQAFEFVPVPLALSSARGDGSAGDADNGAGAVRMRDVNNSHTNIVYDPHNNILSLCMVVRNTDLSSVEVTLDFEKSETISRTFAREGNMVNVYFAGLPCESFNISVRSK